MTVGLLVARSFPPHPQSTKDEVRKREIFARNLNATNSQREEAFEDYPAEHGASVNGRHSTFAVAAAKKAVAKKQRSVGKQTTLVWRVCILIADSSSPLCTSFFI